MDILTLDFETYYDREYSLRKMPTPNYILDPRFELQMCAVKIMDLSPAGLATAALNARLNPYPLDEHFIVDGPDFGDFIMSSIPLRMKGGGIFLAAITSPQLS